MAEYHRNRWPTIARNKQLEFAKTNADLNIKGVKEALYADSVLNREDVLRTTSELVGYANEISENGASNDLKEKLLKYIQDPIFSIGVTVLTLMLLLLYYFMNILILN